MATLSDYGIVRMGARASTLQPDSATPGPCDTEQATILLLCLPSAGGSRNSSEGHSSLPVCNSAGPRVNQANTLVQPETTERAQRRLARGRGPDGVSRAAAARTARTSPTLLHLPGCAGVQGGTR